MAIAHRESRTNVERHEGFLPYARYRWLKIAMVLSVLTIAAFIAFAPTGFRLEHTGGTWFGYISGTIGAALMIWLTMIGIRKRAMTSGAWLLKAWTSAHVYLGLFLLVIVTLHSGFQFSWTVHTLAYVLMLIVVFSGVFGIIMYVRLPRRLSESRQETTQKQMLEMIYALDLRLDDAAQPLAPAQADAVRLSLEKTQIGGNLFRRLSGRYPNCATKRAIARLKAAKRSAAGAPDAALEQVMGLLEQKSANLEKARNYIQIRSLLEIWLFVHVPATFALLAAVTAHIVSVFFYW
jgi:hypothetical protein